MCVCVLVWDYVGVVYVGGLIVLLVCGVWIVVCIVFDGGCCLDVSCDFLCWCMLMVYYI